jgi:hypothetical protein
MTAEAMLSRLDRVKRTGQGRWIARCPAHEDRGPSLSVRELDDGRVLIHCFAGCDPEAVLGACGLTFSDLFHEKLVDHAPRERRPFSPNDVLEAVSFEALVVSVAASSLSRGDPLSESDVNPLRLAAERLEQAAELCRGRHN